MDKFFKPKYIKKEVKRKKIQIIIFFAVTFGIPYILGLPLFFAKFIKPDEFALFMMILPLSSVAISKFYTEVTENEKYKFYSLIILFFLFYLLLFITRSFNLINSNKFLIIANILIVTSSLSIIYCSISIENLDIFKNGKTGFLLNLYCYNI